MSDFLDELETIDQDTVEVTGNRYPVIGWNNGSPAQKRAGGVNYGGGFFIGEDSAPTDMTEFGWVKDTQVSNSGNEIDGYWIEALQISIVDKRRRWVATIEEGGRKHVKGFPWTQFDEAKAANGGKTPRGHEQYIVLLKGAEHLGPFLMTFKGHAAMSFKGSAPYTKSGVLSSFRVVTRAADALAKQAGREGRWPNRAFWCPVMAARNADKSPAFIEVGTGKDTTKIVLPVPFGLPEKPADLTKDMIGSTYFVGKDTLKIVNELYTELEDWRAAWDVVTENEGAGEHLQDDHDEPEAVDEEAVDEMGM